uniref:cyclic nucleotide-gated ion channel 1-like isoform X2 n=1 Tax=Fragaria vesca subsp. vesca TaxID=101020 RepID=UPI0005C9DC6E|nr:PREDICTED: cyclic nucleotide-gated ion channel 1-like isoform X2 [Fragaria vesca subsp. vesca]
MDIPDITLREIVQSSVSNTESNSMKDGHKTSERWFGLETLKSAVGRMVKEILDPEGPILEKWNVIFVISCLFAVLLDPLFLYIPLINHDVKCIGLDKKLKIAAVVFRLITDFVYIVKIIFQIYELEKVTVMAIWRSTYILLDILAVLPIPQVTILIYFTKMRASRSLNTRKFLNFLVLIQYVPRVLRIYLACKEIKNSPKGKLGLWIKGGLNFLMYIFASHILGGFWYFFSVQRMIACWQYACRDEDGCKPSTFNCNDRRTNDDIKLLNDSCPINPSDETIFDFGIFLDALQSGLVGSTDYSQKLSNCFWWGLRNLSSLGSDLKPSINTWENLFAALTSIMGLLLFLYLIGNLQMYMQVESASKEQLRWQTDLKKMMIAERKIRIERSKGPEVEKWLAKNYLPKRFLTEIMEKVVEVDLEQNRDVDVEKIQSILPVQLQSYIIVYKEKLEKEGDKIKLWLSKNRLPLRLKSEIIEAVAQRPEFEQNGVVIDVNNVLSILPSQLSSYIESYIQNLRQKDEEIGMWLSENELSENFKSEIMEAVLVILEEDKEVDVKNILTILPMPLDERIRENMRLLKIDRKMKGADLWLLKNGIPSSKKSDIKEAVRLELNKDADIDVENFLSTVEWIQEFLPFNRLKRLKLLEVLDGSVLKAICEHLKPVEYDSSSYIIQEGQPLEVILFVEGTVFFEKNEMGVACTHH